MKLARRLDRRFNDRRAAARAKTRKDQFRKGLMTERLEDRQLMAGDLLSSFLASSQSAYYNPSIPTDVTADGYVAPNDALAIINVLNAQGSHQLSQSGGEGEVGGRMYVDVNNDGFVAPNDALEVINRLNAEGEPADADDKAEYIFSTTAPFQAGVNSGQANPLGAVLNGQPFDLVLKADDLRPTGTKPNPTPPPPSVARIRGVYAAYADVLFDTSLVQIAVAERQDVFFGEDTASGTGTFTLTFNGQTTAAINYDNSGPLGQITTQGAIESALNAVLGAGSVRVTTVGSTIDGVGNPGFAYRVRFAGSNFLNINQPPLTTNVPAITASEVVAGNSTSFLDAVDFAPTFQNGQTGSLESDRFNELGSFFSGSNAAIRPNAEEILRVHLIAKLPSGATGATPLVFTPSFTDMVRPADDTLVMANTDLLPAEPRESQEVTPSQIAFNTVTISITTGPINAIPDTATVLEDAAAGVTKDVIANDTVNPPATGTISLQTVGAVTPAGAGTATQVGNSIKFVPSKDFSGTATIAYTAAISSSSDTADSVLTVTVTPVNDAPVIATVPTQNISEDAATTVNLTGIAGGPATATDEAAQTVTITATSSNQTLIPNGNITVNYTTGTSGTLQFTPALNQSGSAVITLTVKDDGGTANGGVDTTTSTFTVNVAAVNDAPENRIGGSAITPANPAPDQITVPGVALDFNSAGGNQLSVSDIDAGTANIKTTLSLGSGQGTLTVGSGSGVTVSGNNSGSVTLTGPQAGINAALTSVTYTPQTGFTGTATLTIATDDQGNSPAPAQITTSTITIKLDPGVRPFAVDDRRTIDEADTPVALPIDVLANDFKEDGAVTTIQSVTQPASGQGSVTFTATGLTYTPPGGDFFTPPGQPVTFTYVIDDDSSASVGSLDDRTGTVFITVNNINDAPVATDDQYGTAIGVPLTIAAPGVLSNDNDVDDARATLTAVNAVIAAGQGSVTLNTNGGFTYTPPAGGGDFTFTYQAKDPAGALSNVATVRVHVAAPPQVTNSTATAQEDTDTPISIAANYSDPTENRPLGSVEIVSNVPAAAGTVIVAGDNKSFIYQPADNFNTTRPPASPITFTYKAKASDGTASNVATVSITVNEVNDDPTATNDTFLAVKRSGTAPNEIGVDQPVAVLGNDSFAPDVNETLTVTGVSATSGGTFGTGSVNTTGGGSVKVGTVGGVPTILYTSPGTAPVADSFFYQISDGRGGVASAKVDVSVVDFVPKVISGTVYIDSDNDGVNDAGEKGLASVQVRLTGTSFDSQTANNVNIVVTTDLNGNYAFGAAGSGVTIKPPKDGTSYTLSEVAPLYLLNGLDTNNSTNMFDHDANPGTPKIPVVTNSDRLDNRLSLRWNVTDDSGNVTGLNFGERGIDAASLSDASGFIQEFLATSSGNGMVLAASLSGSVLWNYNLPGWENAKSISVSLSSDLSVLTLNAVDKTNKAYTVTLYQDPSINGSMARFRVLGVGSNGQYIVRVDGTAAECGLGLLTAAAPAGGEGEGSAAAYAASADALFAQQAWA